MSSTIRDLVRSIMEDDGIDHRMYVVNLANKNENGYEVHIKTVRISALSPAKAKKIAVDENPGLYVSGIKRED